MAGIYYRLRGTCSCFDIAVSKEIDEPFMRPNGLQTSFVDTGCPCLPRSSPSSCLIDGPQLEVVGFEHGLSDRVTKRSSSKLPHELHLLHKDVACWTHGCSTQGESSKSDGRNELENHLGDVAQLDSGALCRDVCETGHHASIQHSNFLSFA